MQDVLEVAIGKFVLSINVIKVQQAAPQGYFVPDQPVVCHVDNPLEGVHLLGSHHEDVTDLAVSSIASFRVASASQDGTVRTYLLIEVYSKHWIGLPLSYGTKPRVFCYFLMLTVAVFC